MKLFKRTIIIIINVLYLTITPIFYGLVAIGLSFMCTFDELKLKNGHARSLVTGKHGFWED